MKLRNKIACVTALSVLLAPAALAEHTDTKKEKKVQTYQVDLDPLNESGVEGKAHLKLKDGQLRVIITARGLVPNQTHPQHIHGLDGNTNAVCPTAADAGDDGVLTLVDGLPAYGPVLLPLTPFPEAKNGNITFKNTYEVSGDLADLSDEAIVLHGGIVDGGYVATLPVACGEIN